MRGLRIGNDGLGAEAVAPDGDGQVGAVALRGHFSRQPYELRLLVPRQGGGLAVGSRQNDYRGGILVSSLLRLATYVG